MNSYDKTLSLLMEIGMTPKGRAKQPPRLARGYESTDDVPPELKGKAAPKKSGVLSRVKSKLKSVARKISQEGVRKTVSDPIVRLLKKTPLRHFEPQDESMNWQDRLQGLLLNEISAKLARKVADKRAGQFKSVQNTMTSPEVLARSKSRSGEMGGATIHKDRFDVDDQGTRARKGISGKKDAKLSVPDEQKSGIERRHVPTTQTSTNSNKGVKTKKNPSGETLYTKLERASGRAAQRADRKEAAESDVKKGFGSNAGERDVQLIKRVKRTGRY